MSDLHNEFGLKEIVKTDAEIIVIPGDVDIKEKGVKWIKDVFNDKDVIYLTGNHEYYHGDIDIVDASIRDLTKNTKIRFLQNKKVVINDIRFLGTTLWTDFKYYAPVVEYYKSYCSRSINDYSVISYRNKRFTPDDSIALHEKSMEFLEDSLSKFHDGPTVVVTHHAPLKECVGPFYKDSALNPGFLSDLSELIEKYKPEVWIHGHLHGNFVDFKYDETRIIANPRGYPGTMEYSGFVPDFTINL